MAGEVSIRVEGLDTAISKLSQLAQKLPKEADRIIEDSGEEIFALSQQLVPVDTGALQRSGSHRHEFLRSEISYNTSYAELVHDGTSRMAPRPYLRGAVEIVSPKIEERIAKVSVD